MLILESTNQLNAAQTKIRAAFFKIRMYGIIMKNMLGALI